MLKVVQIYLHYNNILIIDFIMSRNGLEYLFLSATWFSYIIYYYELAFFI